VNLDPTASPGGSLGDADFSSTAPWVRKLQVPAWTVDDAGHVIHCNRAAADLLGVSEPLGRPCHEVVQGVAQDGTPLCVDGCPLVGSADSMTVRRIAIKGRGPRKWVAVFTIPVASDSPERFAQVHIAVDLSREHDWESYLRGVAGRRAGEELKELSEREHEILSLLALGVGAEEIAERLYLSPVTVRNHLHHIYAKLRVHSVAEAVALYLLSH